MKTTFDKMIAELREIAKYKRYKGSLYELFIWQRTEEQFYFLVEHGLDTYAKRNNFYKYLEFTNP